MFGIGLRVYRSLHLYRVQYAIYAIVPQSPRLNRDAKDTDKLIRLKMVCLHDVHVAEGSSVIS